MASPGFYGFFAESDGQIKGAILGNIKPFKGRKEFEIFELFVDSEVQNTGIGSQLIIHLEKVLARDHIYQIVLLTGRATPAFEFYKKKGYQSVDELVFIKHRLLD